MTNIDLSKINMLKRILIREFSLSNEDAETLIENDANYYEIVDYINQKDNVQIIPDEDPRFKKLDVLLNPPWIRHFAKEFDISHEEVFRLHENGMSAIEIRDYLDEIYPIITTTPQASDFIAFSQETKISETEAIEIYNRARKYDKDPYWLAETHIKNHSFEKIDKAFKRHSEIEECLAGEGAGLIGEDRISIITSIYSEIYGIDTDVLERYFENNYDLEFLNNYLLLCDINYEENPKKKSDYLHKLGNKIDVNKKYNWNKVIEELEEIIAENTEEDFIKKKNYLHKLGNKINTDGNYGWDNVIEEDTNNLSHQANYLYALEDSTSSDENYEYIENNLMEEIKKLEKKYTKRAPRPNEINNAPSTFNINSTSEDEYEIMRPYTSQIYNVEYSSLSKDKNETVNPATGSLVIRETDFILPGKLGLDFSFTRIFSSSKCNLDKLSYKIETYYEERTEYVDVPNYTVENIYNSGPVRYYNEDGTFWQDELSSATVRYSDGTCETFYKFSSGLYNEDGSLIEEDPISYEDEHPPVEYESVPVTYYVECTRIVVQSEPDDYVDPFDLGKGWSLNFPKLEITESGKYIWIDGASYEVDSSGYLVNLGSSKFSLNKDSSYSQSGANSSYSLSSVDGDKWYFDSSGNLIALKNKFNVYIRFYYTNNLINKIIDSVGRRIQFTYPDGSTIEVSVYENEVLQDPIYVWNYYKNERSLREVEPPIGQTTQYAYRVDNGTFSSPYNSVNISKLNLTSVTKPSRAIDKYEYTTSIKTLDEYCSLTDYKIYKTYTEIPTIDVSSSGKNPIVKIENLEICSYTEITGIPYSMTKTFYRDSTDLGVAPSTEFWQFDNKGRTTVHRLEGNLSGENRNKTEKITTNYIFNTESSRLPSTVETNITLVGVGTKTNTVKYLWDYKGNIKQETDTIGRYTDYTYDSKNNMLLEKTSYGDPLNGKRINYELDSLGRNIESSKDRGINLRLEDEGTQKYSFNAANEISTSFIWTSPGEITDVSMNICWTTGGFARMSSYILFYRKRNETEWTAFSKPDPIGSNIPTSGTRSISFNLPEKDYYDIKVSVLEGNVKVTADSFATGPKYKTFTDDVTPYIYHTFNYDSEGKLTALNVHSFDDNPNSDTPVESTTKYTYDQKFNSYVSDQTTDFVDVDGVLKTAKSSKEYDSLGKIVKQSVSQIDSDEVSSQETTTEYEYDKLGRLTRTINPPYDSDCFSTVSLEYFDAERKTILTNEVGTKVITYYDGIGRMIYSEWLDSLGIPHLRGYDKYDSLGKLVVSGDALYKETQYTYDSFGRLIKTRFADGNESENFHSYVFENSSTTLQILSYLPSNFDCLDYLKLEKTLDKSGNPVITAYDIVNRVVWRASNPKSATGNQPVWDMLSYEYDSYNRLIKSSVLRERNLWDVTQYEYVDMTSNPARINLPGNSGGKIYSYNSRGLVARYEESDFNYSEDYEYDKLGRIIKITGPETVTKHYNEFGKLSKICRANEENEVDEINLEYNKCGWLTKETWIIDESPYSMQYVYNACGNVVEMKYPDGESVSYEHDELGRVKRIEEYFDNPDMGGIGFTYDERNNLTGLYPNNGINTSYTYDDINQLTSINSSALSLEYMYDPNGNIGTIKNCIEDTELNYEYDRLSRLTMADLYKQGIKKRLAYLYDGAGNRIFEACSQDAVNEHNYLYRLGDRMDTLWEHLNPSMLTYRYLPGNRLDSVTGTKETSYEWDNMGKLQRKTGTAEELEVIYTASNLVKQLRKNGEASETYYYDPTNRRIKVAKDSDTVISLYRGNDLVYEMKTGTSGDVTTTKYITLNGRCLAKEVMHGTERVKYFYHTDMLGSTRVITDIDGNVVESYEYEPFGAPNGSSSYEERYQFTGKPYDEVTGLMYFGARYYDPEVGRFITMDPANDGINFYVYCRNNPLRHIDPDGREINTSNLTDAQKSSYDHNIWILNFSPTFRAMYEAIQRDPRIVYIRFGNDLDSSIAKPVEGSNILGLDDDFNQIIGQYQEYNLFWNPYAAVITTDGYIVLPLLSLAHEFGHIMQYFDGSSDIFLDRANKSTMDFKLAFTLEMENDCVARFESVIGAELGIKYRTNYEGHVANYDLMAINLVATKGPLSTTINVEDTKRYYEDRGRLVPTEDELNKLRR